VLVLSGDLHQFAYRSNPARMPHSAELSREPTDSRRCKRDVLNLYVTRYPNTFYPMQAAADRAAALGTVRIATKDTRLYPGFQIGAVVCRHSCEHTLPWICRWLDYCAC
jgi:hypothetical protein